MSQAWMPLYIGDFLADTMDLGSTERGIYISLLMHAWQHNGTIPRNRRKLALISGCDSRVWHQYEETVLQFFDVVDASTMQHGRVVTELRRYEEISNKRKDAAIQMHSKRSANAHANALPLQSQSPVNPSIGKSTTPRARANGASPDTANGRYYAKFDSPQLLAWEAYTGRQLRDRNGGWEFPTEWPPNIGEQPQAH